MRNDGRKLSRPGPSQGNAQNLSRRRLMRVLPPLIPLIGSAIRPLAGAGAKRTIRYAQTAFGDIAYTEQGVGVPALFVHGVFLNGYLWRHVMDRVADVRRAIAIDLMAHGATKTAPDQDVSF